MKRVLIAEDDTAYAALVADALKEAGCEVTVASDGLKAHRLMRTGSYDLLVLDLAMPGLGGLEVARTLSLKGASVPVIILSAHDTPEVRLEAARAGLRRFLSKDTSIDEIVATVREVLGA